MRLNEIKLAGFKSFVDPTTIRPKVTMDLRLEIADTAELGTVMDKVGALPNITRVQRRTP